MTSSTDWSERTVLPEPPQTTSPSRIIAGDDHIAEFSDLFREAIQARNVYAAWARKLTNARPNDPKLQSYHQEVTKAGESVELLLVKLNVPLFRIPASDEVEYRDLSRWLETTGVEFKSFMLKQDRPVKVVVRGLPSNTEPEDIKAEIEAEGFKVAKISQMKNFRTKTPMPLFYVQIENGVDAAKIYDFTEMFGTRIEVKPFDRGNKPNNNQTKKTTAQAPRPDTSKARKVSPNLDYSKVVQNKIPKEHVSPPSTSKSELRPAPSKDASINAGLLKDLLEVIEESPSIDKQTFCRAFKNSLSALRSASADVDKTYVIFEAYCRLRSLQA
ncbi:zinc finger protein [Trichonephila clavipes]|nr:zinc finger protein [Trichonephila clavipes]